VKVSVKGILATRRRRRLLFLGGVVGFIVVSVAGIEVSSMNWFCGSCHIMESYHASWARSEHKEVDCVQCHIEPGLENLAMAKLNGMAQALDDILNRTSTHPSASVSDLSCTREGCHAIQEVRDLEPVKEPYIFNHASHTDLEYDGIAVHCTTCHSHRSGENHFELNTNVCMACHLLETRPDIKGTARLVIASPRPLEAANGEKTALAVGSTLGEAPNRCKDCHHAPDEPVEYNGLTVVHDEYLAYGAACESCHRGVTQDPEPVEDDRCMSCHDFGRQRIATVEELHRQHAEGRHKVECFSCHGRIEHGPSATTMRLDQVDCRSCHEGEHLIQQETYTASTGGHLGAATSSAVTPMFLAHVDCTGCHVQPRPLADDRAGTATVAVATPEACDACHKNGLGRQMIPLWQNNTKGLYEQVERMLPEPSRTVTDPRAERLVAEARQLLALVRLDGSWGVHNPQYTERLLKQARGKLLEARARFSRID
jgi:nitrate/TMAO reductase-like tetraheme cytochrome c subunit